MRSTARCTIRQAHEAYHRLRSPKPLVTFDAQTGGDSHCQAGNLRLGQEAVFDWLDEQMDSLSSGNQRDWERSSGRGESSPVLPPSPVAQ